MILYFGCTKEHHFHFYKNTKHRKAYFEKSGLNYLTEKCYIFSIDYYKPVDKKKRYFFNPNPTIIKELLHQIGEFFHNKELRFITGFQRGAQSALHAFVNNPEFTDYAIFSELYITENQNTNLDKQVAWDLLNNAIRKNGKVRIIYSEDPHFKIYTSEVEKYIKWNFRNAFELTKVPQHTYECFEQTFMGNDEYKFGALTSMVMSNYDDGLGINGEYRKIQ